MKNRTNEILWSGFTFTVQELGIW